MHHTVYSSTKQKAGLCTVSSLLSSVCCLLFDYCSSTVCLLSVYPSSTVRLLSVYSLSTVRLLFVYSLSTLCLLFIDCLSTFQVPSQTGCSPSLLCTDGAHRCWGTQKSSSKGRLSRRQGMKQRMPQAWLRVPSVSEPCMLTLLTCPSWCIHTRSSKWCLSRRQRMQWVEYLVCQSPACHALAACSASAALRQPESRPQPSALGSIPSPAVCESVLKQCSLHTRHGAEEAQKSGGGRREEEEERRKKRGGEERRMKCQNNMVDCCVNI